MKANKVKLVVDSQGKSAVVFSSSAEFFTLSFRKTMYLGIPSAGYLINK